MSEEENKETKNCGDKYRFFLCLLIQKKNFDPKGLYIKMSSLLNVSNASSKPKEFSIKDIERLVDIKNQNWYKTAHVGKF